MNGIKERGRERGNRSRKSIKKQNAGKTKKYKKEQEQ